MVNIEIQFNRIVVHKDGDGWGAGKGEIYYTFEVDQEVVVELARNQHVSLSDGDTHIINESWSITRNETPGSQFMVSGSVSEADGKFTWDDDHAGSFNIIHTYENGWIPGKKAILLSGKGVSVTIYYTVIVH